MGLSDTGEVLQHVLNGELHGNSRPGVAAVYQALKVLVLPNELVLHGVPHHLVKETWVKRNDIQYELCTRNTPICTKMGVVTYKGPTLCHRRHIERGRLSVNNYY